MSNHASLACGEGTAMAETRKLANALVGNASRGRLTLFATRSDACAGDNGGVTLSPGSRPARRDGALYPLAGRRRARRRIKPELEATAPPIPFWCYRVVAGAAEPWGQLRRRRACNNTVRGPCASSLSRFSRARTARAPKPRPADRPAPAAWAALRLLADVAMAGWFSLSLGAAGLQHPGEGGVPR